MRSALRASGLVVLLTAGCSTLFPPTVPEPFERYELRPCPERSLAALDSRAATLARSETLEIDLTQALALARARSPEIALAKLRTEQETSVERAEELALLPGVNPIFRAFGHKGRAQPQTGIIVDPTRTNFELQVFVAWLVQPGSTLFSALASRRREEAARAAEDTARLGTERDAAIGYFELVRAEALAALAREAVRAGRELERTESSRERLGAATPTAVLRARAELADREQDLSLATGARAVASARLASVLQLPPQVELAPREDAPRVLSLAPADASITSLVTVALDRRPELREARGELGARERLSDSATWGRLFPFVGGFLQTGDFGATLGKMRFSQDAFFLVGWQFGPGGIGDFPTIRERRLAIREERLAIEELETRIEKEVALAKARAETAAAELESARDAVDAASESLRVTRDRLEKGVAIELEALDAERTYFAARARGIEAAIAYDEAQYDLLRACGEAPGS